MLVSSFTGGRSRPVMMASVSLAERRGCGAGRRGQRQSDHHRHGWLLRLAGARTVNTTVSLITTTAPVAPLWRRLSRRYALTCPCRTPALPLDVCCEAAEAEPSGCGGGYRVTSCGWWTRRMLDKALHRHRRVNSPSGPVAQWPSGPVGHRLEPLRCPPQQGRILAGRRPNFAPLSLRPTLGRAGRRGTGGDAKGRLNLELGRLRTSRAMIGTKWSGP
jgi:hypothetical protein